MPKGHPRDLSGQDIGCWHIVAKVPKGLGERLRYLAICQGSDPEHPSCFRRTHVQANHLRSGQSRSCGCATRRHLEPGTRSGHLVVLGPAPEKTHPHAGSAVRVRCDAPGCGKVLVVPGAKLVRKVRPMRSCGCCQPRNRDRERRDPVLRVQATGPGRYRDEFHRPGEVFNVRTSGFIPQWMTRVPSDTKLTRRPPVNGHATPAAPAMNGQAVPVVVDVPETAPVGTQAALDRRVAGLRQFDVQPWCRSRHDDDDDPVGGRALTGDDVNADPFA